MIHIFRKKNFCT